MSCFWTDFVGCSEDCGGDTPSFYVGLVGYRSGAAALGLFGAFDDWSNGLQGIDPSQAVVTDITFYTANDSINCVWLNKLIAVHGEPDGTFVENWNQTLSPLEVFLPDVGTTHTGSGSLAITDIDENNYFLLDQATVAAFTDYGGFDDGVFTITVFDPQTGSTFTGCGGLTGCF